MALVCLPDPTLSNDVSKAQLKGLVQLFAAADTEPPAA